MDSAAMIQILNEVAEEVVRPRFRALAEGDVEQKSPGDLVTVADREAEKAIAARLQSIAPGALLVGEENTFFSEKPLRKLPKAELAYTIDPIDGTSNFVNGSPDYALMVSEVRHGEVSRGWIWQPEYQRSYIVEEGSGVERDGERLRVVVRDRLPIGAASNRRYHGHTAGGLVAPVVSSAWSAAFDYPNLIEGRIDYLYYNRLRPWDHLVGALMTRELGGVSRTRDGIDYGPSASGRHLIVAATPQIWDLANQTWPT